MGSPAQFLEQASLQRHQERFNQGEEQRIRARDAQAALYEQALQNPDLGPEDRKSILQQHASLFQPHEAPTLFSRLGGLIHGQTQKAAAAQQPAPVVPAETAAAPPAPTVLDPLGIPYSDPGQAEAAGQPMHPMQTDHPVLGRFREALDAVGNHLKGFQQPVTPPVDPGADDVLARTYKSPQAVQAEIATKARQDTAQNSLNLEAEKRKRYMLTMTPENRYLAKYAEEHGYDSASDIPLEEQNTALQSFKKANTGVKLTTAMVIDEGSKTGYSKITQNQMDGTITSVIPGVTPPRGFTPTQRISRSTDPATGLTTTSVATTTPQVPGLNAPGVGNNLPGRPVSSKAPVNVLPIPNPNVVPSGPDAAALSAGQQAQQGGLDAINASIQDNKGKAGAPSRKAARVPVSANAPQVPGGPKQLDANGQIPVNSGATDSVREAAQQLIDDRDVDKIPAKVRELGASLARQYGWSQGKFTPREQNQMTVARVFLKKLLDSPSLGVLDSVGDRAQLALAHGGKEGGGGFLHSLGGIVAAHNESDSQAEFQRNLDQANNIVGGVSQITRAGRPTEASLNRVRSELPNIFRAKDAQDARKRINNLLTEIDIAEGKYGMKAPAEKKEDGKSSKQSLADRLDEALGGK